MLCEFDLSVVSLALVILTLRRLAPSHSLHFQRFDLSSNLRAGESSATVL